MRLLKTFPHDRYLIELHHYNQKYILKITLEDYSQSFRIAEMDSFSADKIDEVLNYDGFLGNCLTRFLSMRTDLSSALNSMKK